MTFKVPSVLILLLVIKLFINFHDEVICLELELFDILSKGKRGAMKDKVFGNLSAIVKDTKILRQIVGFPSTLFVTITV